MSTEFSVVLSGPLLDVGGVLFSISRNVEPYGFRHGRLITRIDPDEPMSGGNLEEIKIAFDGSAEKHTTDWEGASARFFVPGITLDIFIARWYSAFLNVSIDVSDRTIREVYREGKQRVYFTALAEIARACQAEGGVGGYMFDSDPINPKDIVNAIVHNPQNPGFPADLGLIKSAAMPRDVVERLAADPFRIEEISGYWFLVGHDFEQLARILK